MKKKTRKKIEGAYYKGREEGFDHGLNTAKMVYNDIVVDLKRQIEELNTEIIDGLSETDTETDSEG